MANKIKIKRGLKASIPTLEVGELGYATNTKELFIGTSSGNELLNKDTLPPTISTDITTDANSDVKTASPKAVKTYVDAKDTVKEQRNGTLLKFWTGTEAQYDAIGTKDANTLYFII